MTGHWRPSIVFNFSFKSCTGTNISETMRKLIRRQYKVCTVVYVHMYINICSIGRAVVAPQEGTSVSFPSRLASSVSQQQPGASSSQSSAAERHQAARTQSDCSRKPGGLDLENKSSVELRWQGSVCSNVQHFRTSSRWSEMSLFQPSEKNIKMSGSHKVGFCDTPMLKQQQQHLGWLKRGLLTQYHPFLN